MPHCSFNTGLPSPLPCLLRSWLAKLAGLHVSPDMAAIYPPLASGEAVEAAPTASGSRPAPSPTYPQATLDFIFDLFHRFIDPLITTLRTECKEAIPTANINLVANTAMLFTALSHPGSGLVLSGELDESTKLALQYVFAFSLTWGLGGALEGSSWDAWDMAVRERLEGCANFPSSGAATVFDYRLDPARNFAFGHWDEVVPKFKYNPATPYFQILVPTTDTTRYAFLLQACVQVHRSVLFTGASGVGKTAVVLDTLARLAPGMDLMPVVLNFSAQTSSTATQAMVEAKLEKKRKRRFGAPAGKHIVLFVDDVNMPQREVYGAQPPLELLRQLQDFGGFYDRKKLFWKEVEGATLCAACGPPGGGRQEMSSRFTRHFTQLNMPPPSETAMRTIFSTILGGFMDSFFNAGKGRA
ncbi:hypothetical protein QJQ45_019798, partial [Haematococcus lacustris]